MFILRGQVVFFIRLRTFFSGICSWLVLICDDAYTGCLCSVPFYLLVTICFGLSVSQDLLPLWILGPLSTGIIIRQFCRAAELSRIVAEKTASQRAQLSATTLALYKDAKEGTLPDKARVLVESKLAELEEKVTTKRSEITVYVSSGQAAASAKDFSVNKLHEFGDYAVDQYADYMEWWRPKGRALSRMLKKIF
jgi:hypothetical protein